MIEGIAMFGVVATNFLMINVLLGKIICGESWKELKSGFVFAVTMGAVVGLVACIGMQL